MKIKQWLLVFFLCMVLGGCRQSLGHFKDGNIDLDQLIIDMNEKTKNQDWEFPYVNQSVKESDETAELYSMDMTNIEHSYRVSSILDAELGEITFFQADESQDERIKQGIEVRLTALKEEWGSLLLESENILSQSKQGRIGEYYYLIVGRDAQKVVNYMQSIE